MTQATVPPLVREYFAGVEEHPVIEQAFDKGWKRYPIRKRVSVAWLRKIQREGVTGVALRAGGRLADFTIEEILRDYNRRAKAPMFGGRVI